MNAANFFSKEQREDIVEAIKKAELGTSGEIRVHIELDCKSEPFDRALNVFELLKMHKTEFRNGVLIYLAVRSRKFAIIGDEGINKVVPLNFWEDIKSNMLSYFKNDNFTEGLTTSIYTIGDKLKAYFPYHISDTNELSNDISFDQEEI